MALSLQRPLLSQLTKKSDEGSQSAPSTGGGAATVPKQTKDSGTQDKDDVFSDSEAEDGSSKSRRAEAASAAGERVSQTTSSSETKSRVDQIASLTKATEQVSIANTGSSQARTTTEPKADAGATVPSVEVPVSESEFKEMAAMPLFSHLGTTKIIKLTGICPDWESRLYIKNRIVFIPFFLAFVILKVPIIEFGIT